MSYLLNTVDFDSCTEQSVGCQRYSRNRPSVSFTDWSASPTDAVYLTAAAESCGSADAGCRAFIRTGLSLPPEDVPGVNLLKNPSFEAVENDYPLAWGLVTNKIISDPTNAPDGSNYYAFGPGSLQFIIQDVEFGVPIGGRNYTLSFSAKGTGLIQASAETSPPLASDEFSFTTSDALSSNWKTYSATLSIPEGVASETFETQIFASLFDQSIRESQLAKFASRILAMDRAEQNISGAN